MRPTMAGVGALAAGLVVLAGVDLGAGESVVYLAQGWSAAEREAFYTLPQGSQIMPFAWFRHLERPGSQEGFYADGLTRHGYLPTSANRGNRAGLPVGFTVERDGRGRWLGLSCAACHTGQVEYRGSAVRIDGGAAQADIFAFLTELGEAVEQTVADRDSPRFERFGHGVLGDLYPARADRLHEQVSAFAEQWRGFLETSTTEVSWGHGRLDGFGMAFNRLAGLGLDRPDNIHPPDAPTSYPQLWGTPWHDRAQWSGTVAHRDDLGRLARNVGQVLGVFAKVRLRRPNDSRRYYRSTANRTNLVALENLVKTLQPPAWPVDVLGPIDQDLAAIGAGLYEQRCASCHPLVPRVPDGNIIEIDVKPVATLGTDPVAARNLCDRRVATGRLEGAWLNIFIGPPLPASLRPSALLDHVTAGVILAPDGPRNDRDNAASLPAYAPPTPQPAASSTECGSDSPWMVYKARSLDGVWATGPFLHNGSVPNLYELFLPEEQRSERFWVGSREFDPVRVGFEQRREPGLSLFDTRLYGNSNRGHDHTRDLTDSQRWALVEYLKTL